MENGVAPAAAANDDENYVQAMSRLKLTLFRSRVTTTTLTTDCYCHGNV